MHQGALGVLDGEGLLDSQGRLQIERIRSALALKTERVPELRRILRVGYLVAQDARAACPSEFGSPAIRTSTPASRIAAMSRGSAPASVISVETRAVGTV